jgi:hypothetical protein
MTPQGQRQMIMVETNSCPSGQKSMPVSDANEFGGYGVVMDGTFRALLGRVPLDLGVLAVVYDKNPMEASGYACVMAERFGERVWLVEYSMSSHGSEEALVRWIDDLMHVRENPTKGRGSRGGFHLMGISVITSAQAHR